MAEALAITALALAAPPCIRAVVEISHDANAWVKLAGKLRLSSHAYSTLLETRILRVINKIRVTLKKGSPMLPEDEVKEFVDKLNRTIELYNDVVTAQFIADPKTRTSVLQAAERAATQLLQDIKILLRMRANETLIQSMKTCLSYDPSIKFPDGTIPAHHRGGVGSQSRHTSSTPRNSTAHTTENMGEPVESKHSIPSPTPVCLSSQPLDSSRRFYIPIDVCLPPLTLSKLPSTSLSSNMAQQNVSKEFNCLHTIPTMEMDEPLIEFVSVSASHGQGVASPTDKGMHGQPIEFSLIDFSGHLRDNVC
ncbi:hypothetical protein DL96DRAFT_1590023, partial [Flagelloscypha sp. PMI_526]